MLAVAATAVIAITACSKIPPHLRNGYVPPDMMAEQYLDAVRWQTYEDARLFIAPQALPAFDEFIKKNSGKLSITDYKMTDIQISPDGLKATIKVKRSYYIFPSVSQKDEEMIQTWVLINGRWFLSGPPF